MSKALDHPSTQKNIARQTFRISQLERRPQTGKGFYSFGARVFLSVDQTIELTPPFSTETVLFDEIEFDNAGFFDLSLNGFIIPVGMAGMYQLESQFYFDDTAASGCFQAVILRGEQALGSNTGIVSDCDNFLQVSATYVLDEDDALICDFTNHADSTLDLLSAGGNTWFSLARLGSFPVSPPAEFW
jgi:hypothetical protein